MKTVLNASQEAEAPVIFCKAIRILSSKCSSKALSKGERTSLRGRDFWIIKLIIQWTFKTRLIIRMTEREVQLRHRLMKTAQVLVIPQMKTSITRIWIRSQQIHTPMRKKLSLVAERETSSHLLRQEPALHEPESELLPQLRTTEFQSIALMSTTRETICTYQSTTSTTK